MIFYKKNVSFYPKELEIEFKVTKFKTEFLDITYGLGYESYAQNKFHYRIYQKPFNAYAYLNFDSNHHSSIFKGIIKTACHRYKYLSCNKEAYNHTCKLFQIRLKRCGYSELFIKKHTINFNDHTRVKQKSKEYSVRCIINFNKSYNLTNVYRSIFKCNKRNKLTIKTCNVTGKKLKTLLLTKRTLHNKLQNHKLVSMS